MRCPRCGDADLEVKVRKGIEVDQCPKCEGLWLDHHELDEMEDQVMDDDRLKGRLMYAQRDGEIGCPKCHKPMTEFNYRANDLPIDFCPDSHGFWLDKGEDKRVLELLEQRVHDLGRTSQAQAQWQRFKQGGKRSFMEKVKDLFRG